jgi:hypothetical protein
MTGRRGASTIPLTSSAHIVRGPGGDPSATSDYALRVLPLIGWVVASVPAAAVLDMPPQAAAIAWVVTPGQAAGYGESSALLSALAEAVEAGSDLRVLSPEQAGLDQARLLACPSQERLSCWTRELDALGGAEQGRLPIRQLIVLSVSRRGAATSPMTAMVLDVDAARHRLGQAQHADAEAALYEATTRTRPVELALEQAHTHAAAISALLEAGLSEALTQAGRWGTTGAIALTAPCRGACVVELDQLTLGAVPDDAVLVRRVPAGPHVLTLRHAAGVGWSAPVDVVAGQTTTVEVTRLEGLGGDAATPAALWISGTSAASLGVGAATVGVVVLATRSGWGCFAPVGAAACARDEAQADAAPALLAMGTGAATAGLAWLLAAALGADDEPSSVPWAPLAVGLALGVVGGVVTGLTVPR